MSNDFRAKIERAQKAEQERLAAMEKVKIEEKRALEAARLEKEMGDEAIYAQIRSLPQYWALKSDAQSPEVRQALEYFYSVEKRYCSYYSIRKTECQIRQLNVFCMMPSRNAFLIVSNA